MADKAVKPGDVIPYTITLTNANDFALTNIIVTDNIPEGTEYVQGSGGEYNSVLNQVKFTAASIPARQEKSFTFYVKVLDGTNVIVNKANYSVAEIVQPDPENPDVPVRVIFETNEVVNPRAVFTEVIPNVPQTGDNASPLVWALLALMSLACITMLMNRKKA